MAPLNVVRPANWDRQGEILKQLLACWITSTRPILPYDRASRLAGGAKPSSRSRRRKQQKAKPLVYLSGTPTRRPEDLINHAPLSAREGARFRITPHRC